MTSLTIGDFLNISEISWNCYLFNYTYLPSAPVSYLRLIRHPFGKGHFVDLLRISRSRKLSGSIDDITFDCSFPISLFLHLPFDFSRPICFECRIFRFSSITMSIARSHFILTPRFFTLCCLWIFIP